MSERTPGPWVVNGAGGDFKFLALVQGGVVVSAAVPSLGDPISDARLIAAAPGLLSAARNALARLDREDAKMIAMGMPALHQGVPGSVNDQLRIAIAKAEGEPDPQSYL